MKESYYMLSKIWRDKSLCKTFHVKMCLICMKWTYEQFRTKTRFDAEAEGNSVKNGLSKCVLIQFY